MNSPARIALASLLFGMLSPALHSADLAGAAVRLEDRGSAATVSAELLAPFQIQIRVDPRGETNPLQIRVELPGSGPRVWPSADVEVRDAGGRAILVKRAGIEWSKLLFTVPPAAADYFVQAAASPAGAQPALPPEKERTAESAGLRVRIAKWHGGRKAALSIRFDDSHPSHLTKAIPILREYGFRGTFMVNPGPAQPGSRHRSDFLDHRTEWEAVARQGDQELANHSAHHRGAVGDDDMEAEIGTAAQAIWDLTPGRSKLLALNLGGGTYWETTRTLRYYLDKFSQFDASQNSTGMDDTYGNRVANFRKILEQHLERGLWCRIHYHSIGEALACSEANFRAALDIAREHQADLWIAGMADIYKYQAERNASRLAVQPTGSSSLSLQITCLTDPALYDQPLTIEMETGPLEPGRVKVRDERGGSISPQPSPGANPSVILFDVPPRSASYAIQLPP